MTDQLKFVKFYEHKTNAEILIPAAKIILIKDYLEVPEEATLIFVKNMSVIVQGSVDSVLKKLTENHTDDNFSGLCQTLSQ
jgi:hypothetical protein